VLNCRERTDLSSHVSYLEQAILHHTKILVQSFVPQALVILTMLYLLLCVNSLTPSCIKFKCASHLYRSISDVRLAFPAFVPLYAPFTHFVFIFAHLWTSTTDAMQAFALSRTWERFPLADGAQPFPAALPESPTPAVRKI